jgi:FkbM family methyltransferase
MSFPNIKRILKLGPTLSVYKLLLIAAGISRPQLKNLSSLLLRPFIHDGRIVVHYSCYGRNYTVFIRKADEESDYVSVMELAVRSVYPLDHEFVPDLVLDGGGNTGLFTLRVAAMYPSAKILLCEPVPRNLAQIETHLSINNVSAEIFPVCIGGNHRTIPFYVREANQSSFDATKPYTSKMEIEVLPLADLLHGHDAQRILIKLDIEGMEIETLESYVPGETRMVTIVGELHDHKNNSPHLERIFSAHGWKLTFEDVSDAGSNFEAWSPAASAQRHTKT